MLPDNFHSSMSSRNSNNPNGLRSRQQQHRRQNSTPTAFRPANVQKLPPQQRQHAGHGHRRGLSLDIRQLSAQAAGQDFMVSTHTNSTGLANHSQHLLREAQQQSIQARPGTQNPYMSLPPSGSDQNLISPLTTPQLQADRFDQSCFGTNALSFASFDGDVNMIMSRAQAGFGDQIAGGRDFDLQVLNTDSALSTPTFASFQESPSAQGWTSEGDTTSTRRSSRRISNGIMDRVNKYETLGFDGLPRPTTPPNQDASNYFPPTPMETPQGRLVKIEPRPSRFTEGYDESMEETIKPSRGRPNRRAQTIFQDIRQQTEQANLNMLPQSQSFDGLPITTPDYMSMVNFNQEFMKLEDKFNVPKPLVKANLTFDSLNNLECDFDNDTDSADLGATSGSDTPAPTMEPAQHFQNTDNMYELTRLQRRVRGRAHRRNQSEASIISNASVADVDPEKSKVATGISQEEIAKYMGEPDTPGGKYRCLFPDCPSTKFGRKENLKSHVQTHLGDRQYKCPSCMKCFVRQHDLKRHAKIHTGVKPFPCPCGNTFARQDALTRHRQRGMCIGAFEGCPVKESKRRGRPPKKRVDGNGETSSSEGPSDDSAATTPTFDDFNADQLMSMTEDAPQMHVPMSSTAPMAATSPSPGFVSPPSYISPEAIMSSHPPTPGSVNQFVLPSHPATPGDAISPPGLTHSTSPTLSSAELDGGIIIPEMFTLDTTPVTTTGMMSTLTADIDDPDMSSAFAYTQTSMLADYESQLKFYNRPEDVFSEDPSFFDNSTFST